MHPVALALHVLLAIEIYGATLYLAAKPFQHTSFVAAVDDFSRRQGEAFRIWIWRGQFGVGRREKRGYSVTLMTWSYRL